MQVKKVRHPPKGTIGIGDIPRQQRNTSRRGVSPFLLGGQENLLRGLRHERSEFSWHRLIESLIQLFYPPKCVFCSKILSNHSDINICSSCYGKIPFLGDGGIYPGSVGNDARGCDFTLCICRYEGIVRDSIRRFKFRDRPGYYRAYAWLMAQRLKKMTGIGEVDLIVFVPLHRERESSRGYNQSQLLAVALGKRLGIPVCRSILLRRKNTRSQSLLSRKERIGNIAGAFAVKNSSAVKGKTILLIDDVMTTGYTLDECGKVLKEAGAQKVIGAVMATGRNF